MTHIGGHEQRIFAQADAGRLIADDPRSDHGIAAIEAGEPVQLLVDASLAAVGSVVFRDDLALLDENDIGAFA